MSDRSDRGSGLAGLDEVELEIERLVAGGDGLGRIDGIPLFVPRTAPGDRVRVRLVERRPDYGRAEVVELLRPSPSRREAPCLHFEQCGGCALQHIEDREQVRLKAMASLETLARIGGVRFPPDRVEVVGGAAWGYRLRTQLRLESGPRWGYFERRSHDLVDVRECPVLVPELEALLPQLGELLDEGEPPRRIDLACGDERVTSAPPLPGLGGGAVTMQVGPHRYEFDSRCFFQGHRELLPKLVERAVGVWTGGRAIDLFAGVGLFALPLAARYDCVDAVEGDRIAARYARRNLAAADRGKAVVHPQSVEGWLASASGPVDRILVDPPRAGLSASVRRSLLALAPERLTYVSCHPATLARDLRELVASYEVEAISLFDLFPQTGHMEAIVQLGRRPAEPVGLDPWAAARGGEGARRSSTPKSPGRDRRPIPSG